MKNAHLFEIEGKTEEASRKLYDESIGKVVEDEDLHREKPKVEEEVVKDDKAIVSRQPPKIRTADTVTAMYKKTVTAKYPIKE